MQLKVYASMAFQDGQDAGREDRLKSNGANTEIRVVS